MQFEWDDNKNRINQRKHGISFEIAKHIWDDPHVWIYFDRHEGDEDRFHAVGIARGMMLLTVVHTHTATTQVWKSCVS